MRNVCNVCMPHAMGDIISGICIGIATADGIGCPAPAQYRFNPSSGPILNYFSSNNSYNDCCGMVCVSVGRSACC